MYREIHPFLVHKGPIAVAHRGGAGDAPENTMPAFWRAYKLGYRYFETDVEVTRDGVIVAIHDLSLDRVSDRTGAIADLTIAEVEAADAGYHFTTDGQNPFQGTGVKVPRLDELLLTWPDVRVIIDPKSDRAVAPLARLVSGLNAWDRVCVGAFSDRRLRRVRELSAGRACTSMGPGAVAAARLAAIGGRMPRLGADCLQVPMTRYGIPIVTHGFLEAAHRAGMKVHVWTVNEEEEMRALLDIGVDGLITDRLAVLASVFAERGLRL